MKPEEVFESLKRKNIFDISLVSEARKREIFLKVWERSAHRLRREYNREGFGRNSDDIGFGYLIEEFAKNSLMIPHNTDRGNHVAELLLSFLRNGDDFGITGLKGKLCNPDFLEVKITGRRTVINGIVEIKSSAEALRKKLDSQIINQEPNLRKLISAIENKKTFGNAHSFFQKRKIVVAEKLSKKIMVPLGEGDKARALLSDGWECVEIEFSYQELIFIAQAIWPGFENRTSRQSIGDGYLADFEREFIEPLIAFSGQRLRDVLCDSAIKKIPTKEILLGIACLGKIPLLDKDINWLASYMNRNEFYGLFPAYPEKELRLMENRELSDGLMKWYLNFQPKVGKEKASEHILFFLLNVENFSKVLSTSLKNDEQSSLRLNGMDIFSLTSFIR